MRIHELTNCHERHPRFRAAWITEWMVCGRAAQSVQQRLDHELVEALCSERQRHFAKHPIAVERHAPRARGGEALERRHPQRANRTARVVPISVEEFQSRKLDAEELRALTVETRRVVGDPGDSSQASEGSSRARNPATPGSTPGPATNRGAWWKL